MDTCDTAGSRTAAGIILQTGTCDAAGSRTAAGYSSCRRVLDLALTAEFLAKGDPNVSNRMMNRNANPPSPCSMATLFSSFENMCNHNHKAC